LFDGHFQLGNIVVAEIASLESSAATGGRACCLFAVVNWLQIWPIEIHKFSKIDLYCSLQSKMRTSLPTQASMTSSVPVSRLLGRVASSAMNKRASCVHVQQLQVNTATSWVSARQMSNAAKPLSGRNIFQLKAAVETMETASEEQQSQQQQPQKLKQPKASQQQQQQQQQPAIVPLPTSDESEALLKIRHSVSVVWPMMCCWNQK
jgi:hypothetical protein